MRDAHVEAKSLDILRDAREPSVGRLAQGERGLAEMGRAGKIRWRGHLCCLAHQPPEPLHESPSALNPLLGPNHISFGGRIGEHETKRSVGAVAPTDVVRGY